MTNENQIKLHRTSGSKNDDTNLGLIGQKYCYQTICFRLSEPNDATVDNMNTYDTEMVH